MWSHSLRQNLCYSVIEGVTFQRAHFAGFCQSKQCKMELLNAKLLIEKHYWYNLAKHIKTPADVYQ